MRTARGSDGRTAQGPSRQPQVPGLADGTTPEEQLRLRGLSPREAEVAILSARGLLVARIADTLQLAPGTVKALLARAREKLGCRSVGELARVLLREGVIDPEMLIDPLTSGGNAIIPRGERERSKPRIYRK